MSFACIRGPGPGPQTGAGSGFRDGLGAAVGNVGALRGEGWSPSSQLVLEVFESVFLIVRETCVNLCKVYRFVELHVCVCVFVCIAVCCLGVLYFLANPD